MTGATTTRRPEREPRTWRFLALVASLSLALAGLVGLGLAPAANAALVCPAGYDLVAGVCIDQVDAIQVIDEPACDEGVLVGPDDALKCEIPDRIDEIPAIATPSCPRGGVYDEAMNKCVKDATQRGPLCPIGELRDGYMGVGCYGTGPLGLWLGNALTWYTCTSVEPTESAEAARFFYWDLDGTTCTGKPDTDNPTYSCEAGYEGPFEVSDAPVGVACDRDEWICTKQLYRYEDPNYTWICPEGAFGPFVGATPVSTEVVLPFCEFRTTPTDDTPAAFVGDFCPNLEGVQWENYDCNTPQPVAQPEIVPPVQPAVVAPATVVAPAAATVAAPAPATVSGGVAGTVVAPAAATVPTMVPAGDGPQAPTVPIWAFAMMVAGVLGTALASAKLVGARK